MLNGVQSHPRARLGPEDPLPPDGTATWLASHCWCCSDHLCGAFWLVSPLHVAAFPQG